MPKKIEREISDLLDLLKITNSEAVFQQKPQYRKFKGYFFSEHSRLTDQTQKGNFHFYFHTFGRFKYKNH